MDNAELIKTIQARINDIRLEQKAISDELLFIDGIEMEGEIKALQWVISIISPEALERQIQTNE